MVATPVDISHMLIKIGFQYSFLVLAYLFKNVTDALLQVLN